MTTTKKRAKKKRTTRRYGVSAPDFVKAWQGADSVDAVVTATGLPKPTVYSRVNSYRKKGIKLKKMPRPTSGMDIEALNAIAAKAAKKEK